MKFTAIIPARYASSRFPGKPLALLGGKPVVQWVYERASRVFDSVAVATDDRRIADAVASFGGTAVMTSSDHPSGTDRVREAFNILGAPGDVVVNIQGDEPFISIEQLRALAGCFDDPRTDIATVVRPFRGSFAELADPNKVKAVRDDAGYALYFSRSVIPYMRGHEPEEWPALAQYYIHVGLYAYRAAALAKIADIPQSPLEKAESLEQLRWLQAGMSIRTAVSDDVTVGIDTPADLAEAQKLVNRYE
ncbi:MAG: 3-deoxy-manno-octulosonate cytidylyltransferase [Muribaculaceae bacterium]|nr:3-deoxy-manno-octulosonate cytidylyltransferase [Muribaculaceae bacterium]